jgi:uncharacterized membrane protein (UPF0127 family)
VSGLLHGPWAGLIVWSMGPLLAACSPCGADARASVRAAGDDVSVCATVLTRDADRRAGLTLFPKLEVDRGLVLRARLDTRLCITTAPLDYAIDIVFADHLGEVKAVACDRSPTDATVCAEDVRDVLELLPRPGCEGWVGGQLVVEP